MKAIVDEPGVMETLESLDIHEHEIDWLFDILDTDGNRILSIDEFVNGMLHVKSSEQSRQLFQVQHALLKEIRTLRREIPSSQKLQRVNSKEYRVATDEPLTPTIDEFSTDPGERAAAEVCQGLDTIRSLLPHVKERLERTRQECMEGSWDDKCQKKTKLVKEKLSLIERQFGGVAASLDEVLQKAKIRRSATDVTLRSMNTMDTMGAGGDRSVDHTDDTVDQHPLDRGSWD